MQTDTGTCSQRWFRRACVLIVASMALLLACPSVSSGSAVGVPGTAKVHLVEHGAVGHDAIARRPAVGGPRWEHRGRATASLQGSTAGVASSVASQVLAGFTAIPASAPPAIREETRGPPR
jgi:hypothetical protein